MRLKDLRNEFNDELHGLFEPNEIDQFFHLLLQHHFGITRLDLAIKPHLSYPKKSLLPLLGALESLKKQTPLQYILGETEFYGLTFKVTPNVLIPRPETEELVTWILEHPPSSTGPINILDVGTGSGCIAVSLAKKLPNAQVYALDLSKEALEIAKQNAALNQVSISTIHANILEPQTWSETFKKLRFHIIVSNPPYVRTMEKNKMKPNVLMHEPHLALFVEDNDPLVFYRAIAACAVDKLIKNGRLYFEINEYLGAPMLGLMREFQYDEIELRQDIFKKDRMIKGTKGL